MAYNHKGDLNIGRDLSVSRDLTAPGFQNLTPVTATGATTVSAEAFQRILCVSAGGSVTVNLPAGTDGDRIEIIDADRAFGTNNCSVVPNGAEAIDGTAATRVLTLNGQVLMMQFIGASNDWRVIENSVGSDPVIRGDAVSLSSTANALGAWDADKSDTAFVAALSEDTLVPLVTNAVANEVYTLNVTTDGTDRVVSFNANYIGLDGTAMAAVTVPASSTRSFQWQYDGVRFAQLSADIASDPSHATIQTLTDGAGIVWDMSLGHIAQVTIADNRTMGTPTNLAAGQVTHLSVTASGADRTLTFPADFLAASGATKLPVTVPDGATRTLSFQVNPGATALVEITPEAAAGNIQQLDASLATINWDASLGRQAYVTMTASHALAFPTNVVPGDVLHLVVYNNTGSDRTLGFNLSYVRPSHPVSGLSIPDGEFRSYTFVVDPLGTKAIEVGKPDLPSSQVLTSGATINWDAQVSNSAYLGLGHDATLNNPTMTSAAGPLFLAVKNNATPHTLTFPLTFKDANGNNKGTVSFAASESRSFLFVKDNADFHEVGTRATEAVWQFTTGNQTVEDDEYWVITGAHTMTLPAAPNAGDSVVFAPGNGDWDTLGAVLDGGTNDVGNGQSGILVGADAVTAVYDLSNTNWVLFAGAGGVTPADFTGDSGAGGAAGLVPAPAAGDGADGKVLLADGTWGHPVDALGTGSGGVLLSKAAHQGKVTLLTGTTTVALNDGFDIGGSATFIQTGAGTVDFAAGGMTLNSFDGLVEIGGLYGSVTLLKTAASTYVLIGNLG